MAERFGSSLSSKAVLVSVHAPSQGSGISSNVGELS